MAQILILLIDSALFDRFQVYFRNGTEFVSDGSIFIRRMFYGRESFDPWRIVGQIVFLQCVFYIIIGLALILLGIVLGFSNVNLYSIFGYRSFSFAYMEGLVPVGSYFLTVPGISWFIYITVQRSKKSLDFSSTLYILHLLFTIMYGGFPDSSAWWTTQILSFIGTAFLSEYLCIRQELRDIPMDEEHQALAMQEL